MKKSGLRYFALLMFSVGIMTYTSGCKTGEGCDTSKYNSENFDQTKTKRGKSSLFSKKQKKKMGR